MTMLMNVNLLFIRYVLIEFNDRINEGLILQWPWWGLKTALKRGRFIPFQ